jgi:hypothetical protein
VREAVAVRAGVEQTEHEVRELLVAPHRRQPRLGIASEPLSAVLAEARGQLDRVLDGQVHALAAGGSDQVRCVAREEEPARLHRLADADAEGEHVALDELALRERRSVGGRETLLELPPDPVVRPDLEPLVRWHLEHEPRQRGRAAHLACEAARMEAVDRALAGGRHRRDQRQPPGRVRRPDRLHLGRALREAARGSVAGGDDLTANADRLAAGDAHGVHRRAVGVLLHALRRDPEPDVAAHREQRLDPVADELLLRIDVVPPAARELAVVEDERRAVGAELAGAVLPASLENRLGEPVRLQQLDGAVLDEAGLDAGAERIGLLELEDDERDRGSMQEVREHEARRPRSHDAHDDVAPRHRWLLQSEPALRAGSHGRPGAVNGTAAARARRGSRRGRRW